MSSDAPPLGVTAVIAAAGSGERLGAGGPKAFVPLAGRPMVEWSIAAFRAVGAAAIVVAVPPEVAAGEAGSVPETFVSGGESRAVSVSNALAVVETELVAIHDAARPLVTRELIEGVVATLVADPDAAGAIAAAAVTDTIKRTERRLMDSPPSGVVDPSIDILGTVDRDELWAAQTPQVFRTDALRAAISAARAEELTNATDEAMLVEAAGGKVLIHPSPAENLKITTPLDLQFAEARLST
jgi:2-C-methyl-D-erythritol 4-phosphate cytidylyltransferase